MIQTLSELKGKAKLFIELTASDAAKQVVDEIDENGLQKLIENGDEFQLRIVTGIREILVSTPTKKSSCSYFKDDKVKGIMDHQQFPSVFSRRRPRLHPFYNPIYYNFSFLP